MSINCTQPFIKDNIPSVASQSKNKEFTYKVICEQSLCNIQAIHQSPQPEEELVFIETWILSQWYRFKNKIQKRQEEITLNRSLMLKRDFLQKLRIMLLKAELKGLHYAFPKWKNFYSNLKNMIQKAL